MNKQYAIITRAALLLALTLVFQSLRFIIPIPAFLSMFVIGSLVNACLAVAVETVGIKYGLVIAISTPIVAYFQQMLPLPIFIIPVALGNGVYMGGFLLGQKWKGWWGIMIAAVSKSLLLYAAFTWLLTTLAIPAKLATSLMLVMSWPQLITGIIGGMIAIIIKRRLQLLS